MKNKLKDARGETLVEVLASILICALSVAMLFGSVMASSNMDRQAQELDNQYYLDLTKAERQQAGSGTNTGDVYDTGTLPTVKVKGGASGEKSQTVKFYGTDRLLSYAWQKPTNPGGGGG